MRFIVMFVTAVCVLFIIKLRWPKTENFYVREISNDFIVSIRIRITLADRGVR